MILMHKGGFVEHPRVSFIFHMAIPKSTPKKWLPLYESGLLKHEKKPDVDNLLKLYLDCLDGLLFEGDQRVSLGNCIKLYSSQPRTVIMIQETTPTVSPLELSDLVRAEVFGISSFSQTEYQPELENDSLLDD